MNDNIWHLLPSVFISVTVLFGSTCKRTEYTPFDVVICPDPSVFGTRFVVFGLFTSNRLTVPGGSISRTSFISSMSVSSFVISVLTEVNSSSTLLELYVLFADFCVSSISCVGSPGVPGSPGSPFSPWAFTFFTNSVPFQVYQYPSMPIYG